MLYEVITATGTFLGGLVHIGLKNFPAGRMGDAPSNQLSTWFKEHGFTVGRMKTGTVPRLDSTTIDYAELDVITSYSIHYTKLYEGSPHLHPGNL